MFPSAVFITQKLTGQTKSLKQIIEMKYKKVKNHYRLERGKENCFRFFDFELATTENQIKRVIGGWELISRPPGCLSLVQLFFPHFIQK